MKKKLKKSLACLLAALLIFSTVPMSALADEAAAPITVETVAEEAAPNTEPDAEPTPESTAEPTATPEASAKPSAEPTAEPTPEVTEEPAEPETSAEPKATAEPTASPTPNPEDGISLLALGDEAITRYRTVGINGNFSSNYLYDLGQYPLYDILFDGTSYPAYCLQHGKGRVNNGAYVQRDNFGMTEAMRRIVAYGFNATNSLQDGSAGWYSAETAKMMVTQHLVWLASEGYITVNGTNWSWGSGVDTDVERMANLAYNGSVVRSYYAELKDRLLRSEIVPSFAGKSSDGSDAQEITLQLVNGKYTATVTDTNGVLDLFNFQQAGFDISRNGNMLTISTSTLPEQETTIIGAGYTVGDKNSIAVWEDRDQQANIQHQATCPGTTKTMAYIKIKGEKPSYTITLNKTSADLTVTNGNPNYSLKGAVYYVYEYVNTPDYPYWDYEPYATFTTDENGHAELSKKLSPNDYVTFEAVAPKGYCADSKIHKFTITGETTLNVVDDPGVIILTVRKKDSDTNTGTPAGNASLEGAVYRVSYTQNGQEVYKDITTNSNGVAALARMQNNEQLPLTDMQKLYKTAAEIWLKDDHPENHIHLRLARMYEYGLGVPEDLSLAIDHYKAALKTPETEYKLGQLMQRIDGDATEIYAHYAAARVGMLYAEEHRPTSATAQQAVRLATMYRYGLGCDADHETAVHWYTVAAERGSIYAQQRLEVMEMQRIRQEQRAAEYAEKQQQQQNLSFAARLLNTIGNALCRQTLRDQQSATATTDRKQRRMQRRLKRALGQKEDYEQIFQ